ncbi:MAG: KdsC family phosphatase [Fidelibacterota bacterium]
MNRDLKESIGKIKIILTDVDGVLTDGTIYTGNDGLELKRFSILDGAGAFLARAGGLKVVIVSGRYSPATEQRARELRLEDDCYQGRLDKVAVLKELKSRYGFRDEEAAYVGDDIIDLEIMEQVGLPVAVANSHPLVKAVAKFTTRARGGEGAFREAVEIILEGKGILVSAVEKLQRRISSDS